jgi:hypothetical protein
MFASVLKLYRELGRPQVTDESTYSYDGPIGPGIDALIRDCERLDQRFGEVEVLRLTAETAQIEVSLPRGDVGKFYTDAKKLLVSAPSIASGVLPANFYLITEDYLPGDDQKPADVKAVESLTAFIKLLTDFAEDSHGLSTGGQQRLLFVLPPDGRVPQKTIVVPIILEAAALENQLNHFSILESLVNSANEKKLHIEERRLVMKVAIGDVLAGADPDANKLTYLVKNWQEVLKKYRYNFQAYINKFAFDEVRKKIADAEIEYASKLGGVLGDIAGKLLALPVSLLALIALEQVNSDFAFWIGCLALFVVTAIYIAVLHNQKLQVTRLKASFDLAFSPFFSKIDTYPKVLRDALSQRESGVEKQVTTLNLTFYLFYFIAVLPAIGAVYQIWRMKISPLIGLFSSPDNLF